MAPKVSFVISTVGSRCRSLEKLLIDLSRQSMKDIEVVVVVQRANRDCLDFLKNLKRFFPRAMDYNVFPIESIGLSKSRNVGLNYAKGDFLVLCDDDCGYPISASEIVLEEMNVNPQWDIVTFQIGLHEDGSLFRRYPRMRKTHNLRSLMNVISIEITIRRHVVKAAKPLFDENFGLGTHYPTGAENIMLLDLYKKRYKMGYVPTLIAYHDARTSASGLINSNRIAFAKGAMFRRMFGVIGIIPAMFFFVRRMFPDKKLRFTTKQTELIVRGFFSRG